MKKVILTMLCLGMLFQLTAQKADKTMKWGNIPSADLRMTTYDDDSSAAAVVLFDKGHIIVELEGSQVYYRLKRHRRVKILRSDGLEKANIVIPYAVGKQYAETFSYLKAQTFTPDGTKTTLTKQQMIDEVIGERRAEKRFTFPNVIPGAVLEYRYEIVSPHIAELRDWYFQEDIPVIISELKVQIPKWFKYIYLFQGNQQLTQEVDNDRSLDIRGNNIVHIKGNVYQMKNVPALAAAPFITTMTDYRSRLRLQLREIQYPSGNTRSYLPSWEELAEKIANNEGLGAQWTHPENYSALLNDKTNKIINSNDSELEKAKRLYQYVAGNIRWNQQFGMGTSQGLNQVYENKSGHSGELNLALLVLLKAAKIRAQPVFVSTRDHGRMLKSYAIMDQFNHLFISAELDGITTLLDVSGLNPTIGLLPIHSLNRMGCLMDADGSRWIDILPEKSSRTLIVGGELTPDGHFYGNLQGRYKGYFAVNERKHLMSAPDKKKALPQKWYSTFPNIRVDSIVVKNANAYDKTLHFATISHLPAVATVNDDYIYFPPVLLSDFNKNCLTDPQRTFPLNFAFPFQENYILNLKVPEGYRIESVPADLTLELPGKSATFNFMVSYSDDLIQLMSKITFNQQQFEMAIYDSIKSLFEQIANKQTEPIVFRRIEKN